MSYVFVSYKREDEARVARIIQGLEAEGIPVWWDKGLVAGENWRHGIEQAFEGAHCMVVIWSTRSVGALGSFVRDEAARAMARGLLIPVLIDEVEPPLGFGELQAIKLWSWRGNRRDPFFQDLVAGVRAKLAGEPAPKPVAPAAALRRRIRIVASSALGSLVFGSVVALANNVGGVATNVCTASMMQPGLSDACGAIGVGGRPSHAERMFWANRRRGICDDLRTYIDRYHDHGFYTSEAEALLAARRVKKKMNFAPTEKNLTLYVMHGDRGTANIDSAKHEALLRAQSAAERLCKGFTATSSYRFISAKPQPSTWSCEGEHGSVSCAVQGEAICALEVGTEIEQENCGN